MADMCPKIQNGGQSDTFQQNDNMAPYITSSFYVSIYLDVLQ